MSKINSIQPISYTRISFVHKPLLDFTQEQLQELPFALTRNLSAYDIEFVGPTVWFSTQLQKNVDDTQKEIDFSLAQAKAKG